MIIRGLTLEALKECASKTGVDLYNLRPCGRGFAFVLRPLRGVDKYRAIGKRKSWDDGEDQHRRKWAVCYHGHADFMGRVFEVNQQAVIVSKMARFDGALDFYKKRDRVADADVGSQVDPRCYGDACYCDGVPPWVEAGFKKRKTWLVHKKLADAAE